MVLLRQMGDNFNDTFNFSALNTKENPKFQIYDRYGKLVFTGSKNNNFTWDGTFNYRKLPTAAYWLSWNGKNSEQILY
jgi:gliding motility-associated-like protein